ncbi:SIR2 family NAD-dependent protein deacylase [Psychromonas sp. L1A2]|uniref:SIR2 family NAD-dependent protein deacylase n=1 Tax=Psychromonas sp. L1A2 TaxID=2686356 RepID=UPI00135763B5|nr:SIR2 family protein [Psychromonas sp. L1A2]
MEKISKKKLLKTLSESSDFGNLGVFVGAGFSKAVLNNGAKDIALSWGELLQRASNKMSIKYDDIDIYGVGYPEVASKICELHSAKNDLEYSESLFRLKEEIAALTSWYPEKEQREKYSAFLNSLLPNWIITTNYDLVLESLFTGKCLPLSPNESMCAPKGIVPIYHLHGIRSTPESIVIAQEDYVSLFRPHEYRQIKLALTIKESTVLLLGYGLGDVNVLTALDWSKNVFSSSNENYPNEVIQVVRKDNPSRKAYKDRNGILIYEVSDLDDFFEGFSEENQKYLEKKENDEKELSLIINQLEEASEALVSKFIDDGKFRLGMLKVLAKFTSPVISGFISFLSEVFDELWKRAEPNGAFEAYNKNLIVQLDMLTILELEQIPPALLETIAYNLNRVGYYVGNSYGESRSANSTFNRRKAELTKEAVIELANIAEQHRYDNLKSLIERINV